VDYFRIADKREISRQIYDQLVAAAKSGTAIVIAARASASAPICPAGA
jgi:hypothetical protein